jgi:hypothetical protein
MKYEIKSIESIEMIDKNNNIVFKNGGRIDIPELKGIIARGNLSHKHVFYNYLITLQSNDNKENAKYLFNTNNMWICIDEIEEHPNWIVVRSYNELNIENLKRLDYVDDVKLVDIELSELK